MVAEPQYGVGHRISFATGVKHSVCNRRNAMGLLTDLEVVDCKVNASYGA